MCEASYTGRALRAVLTASAGRQSAVPTGTPALKAAKPKRKPTTTEKRTAPTVVTSRALAGTGDLRPPLADSFIQIRGAAQHNLQSIDLTVPRDQMSVFCGPSGSGKSSLAMDTLYAEGQRRYVESLSAYARQFLGQMPKLSWPRESRTRISRPHRRLYSSRSQPRQRHHPRGERHPRREVADRPAQFAILLSEVCG